MKYFMMNLKILFILLCILISTPVTAQNEVEKITVICLPNLLIDMTNKKEYRINDDILLKQIRNWIDKIKK